MKNNPSPNSKDPRAGSGATEVLTGMAEAAKKLERREGTPSLRDVSVKIDHHLYGSPKKKA